MKIKKNMAIFSKDLKTPESFFHANIFHAPMATRRQPPIVGRKRTLSATTNPTKKSILEDGRKVATPRDKENAETLASLLLLVSTRRLKMAREVNIRIVQTFLVSKSEWKRETGPNLQSCLSSDGHRNSQTLAKTKYR